jgi:hypothetical protein
MRKFVLFSLIVICCFSLWAQERKLFWDGYDWCKIEQVCRENPEFIYWVKSAYLSGLFDGKFYYQLKMTERYAALADSVFADRIMPDDFRFLIAGLDTFYKDGAIRYLPLPCALIATQMLQQDIPKVTIEEYIQECRDWINTLTLELYR